MNVRVRRQGPCNGGRRLEHHRKYTAKAEKNGGECSMDKLSIDVRICYFDCKDTPFLGEPKNLREHLHHKNSLTV